MRLFKSKIVYFVSLLLIYLITISLITFANDNNQYVYSEPINDMAMFGGRFKDYGVLMIGDETLENFKNNVYLGFDYEIEKGATVARLKENVKNAKKYAPNIVIFNIGVHDYMEKTSLKEFKDTLLDYNNILKAECNAKVLFMPYLDYKEYNGNPHSYADYDNVLRELDKEVANIVYIDTKYPNMTDMITDGVNYNNEYLFYMQYALTQFIYNYKKVRINNIFVGDSRTVDLSKVNKEKGSLFIGIPAGKYLEFEKTMDNIIKRFYSNCNVIILYGINDIEKSGNTNVEKYIDYLNAYHNDFFAKNINLYIATVMEQKDLENIITFPRNYTLYSRNSALNFLDGHIHTIDLYTYFFILTAKLGRDKVFDDEIHFTDEVSELILEYLYDNIN